MVGGAGHSQADLHLARPHHKCNIRGQRRASDIACSCVIDTRRRARLECIHARRALGTSTHQTTVDALHAEKLVMCFSLPGAAILYNSLSDIAFLAIFAREMHQSPSNRSQGPDLPPLHASLSNWLHPDDPLRSEVVQLLLAATTTTTITHCKHRKRAWCTCKSDQLQLSPWKSKTVPWATGKVTSCCLASS